MPDEDTAELGERVLEFFRASKKKMMTSRDVGDGLGLDHRSAKKVLSELVNEGKLEFTSFGGATFIKLPD